MLRLLSLVGIQKIIQVVDVTASGAHAVETKTSTDNNNNNNNNNNNMDATGVSLPKGLKQYEIRF